MAFSHLVLFLSVCVARQSLPRLIRAPELIIANATNGQKDGRTLDHPVDGFVRYRDKLLMYVHLDVPSISETPHHMIAEYQFNQRALLDFTRNEVARTRGCKPRSTTGASMRARGGVG